MLSVPEEYIIQKFFQLSGAPAHNRHNKTYQGSCPICREGKSWLKKRRCFYIPKNNNIYCHNCGWSSTPIRWILEVSGMTFRELQEEIEENNFSFQEEVDKPEELVEQPSIPNNSINLSNTTQVEFFKKEPVVVAALDFIKSRRLDTAIYSPNYYISLDDFVHKNRLIIPFIDTDREIVHYQSRSIPGFEDVDKPRYISKQNSEKTLFNFHKVDQSLEVIFVFEGPLNACFTKNGVAVAGIQENSQKMFTDKQYTQLRSIPYFRRVWVLDSQWIDNASRKKSAILASQGEEVFIWPEKLGKQFKDFNDIAIAAKLDQISHEFILNNTFKGIVAEVKLRAIPE